MIAVGDFNAKHTCQKADRNGFIFRRLIDRFNYTVVLALEDLTHAFTGRVDTILNIALLKSVGFSVTVKEVINFSSDYKVVNSQKNLKPST